MFELDHSSMKTVINHTNCLENIGVVVEGTRIWEISWKPRHSKNKLLID
ncbi:MAG: hypothetical protein ACFFD4_09705 [Candidatus Odinarchaeota archaeon]